MSLRCGCRDQGDDIVFGPVHQCAREGLAPVNLERELGRALSIYDLVSTGSYDTPEPRYLETLDEAERTGH